MERTWWEKGAACGETDDPEAFFELENAVDTGRVADPARVASALALCATCPVRERCEQVAVETRSYGIWGGKTAAERGRRYHLRVVEQRR